MLPTVLLSHEKYIATSANCVCKLGSAGYVTMFCAMCEEILHASLLHTGSDHVKSYDICTHSVWRTMQETFLVL